MGVFAYMSNCLRNCCYRPTPRPRSRDSKQTTQLQDLHRAQKDMDDCLTPRSRQERRTSVRSSAREPKPVHEVSETQVDRGSNPARRRYRGRSLTEREKWELRLDRLGSRIDETIRFVDGWGTETGREVVELEQTQSSDRVWATQKA